MCNLYLEMSAEVGFLPIKAIISESINIINTLFTLDLFSYKIEALGVGLTLQHVSVGRNSHLMKNMPKRSV